MLRNLQTGDYFVVYKMDPLSRQNHIFFAFNDAQAIYRENTDVLLMDCTYRTNLFNLL
jgi:DNA invertase Pin-like site-specific DNA recombinase